jgi:hypothetical protein
MVFVSARTHARFLNFVIPAKAGIQFLFFIPTKASQFVIPAEAGIHLLLAFDFRRYAKPDSRPCELPSHPCEGVTFSCLCKRK